MDKWGYWGIARLGRADGLGRSRLANGADWSSEGEPRTGNADASCFARARVVGLS